MKRSIYLTALLAMLLTAACEKPDFGTDEDREEETEDIYEEDSDFEVEKDSTSSGILTVAEAIETGEDETVTVLAYIVGATTRSMKYARFAPPFINGSYELKASILLCDKPVSEGDEAYDDDLLPVCINEFRQYQQALNLYDHPEHWNKQILITAIRKKYYGLPGLKKIIYYKILDEES